MKKKCLKCRSLFSLDQIRRWLLFFDRNRWPRLGRAIACFLIEPKAFMRTLLHYPFGFLDRLRLKKLSSLDIKGEAVLLLHGDHHNPSAFFGLSRYLKKQNGVGPLFTLSLPSGEVTEKDLCRVREKLTVIRGLYENKGLPFVFNIVGHSRGAEVALHFLSDPNLSKVIALGTPISTLFSSSLSLEEKNRLFEVDGLCDVLVLERSSAPNRASFFLGHLGLLHSANVFHQVYFWLRCEQMGQRVGLCERAGQ